MNPTELLAMIGALAGLSAIGTSILTARSSASKSQVDSLSVTITTLQAENKRLRERLDELEKDNALQRSRVDTLECENEMLKTENANLKSRIEHLEKENRSLKGDK